MKLSHQQIRDLLSAALAAAEPNSYPWIRDVYESELTYEIGQRLYRRSYQIDAQGTCTLGAAEQVLELKTFVPASFSGDGAYFEGDYRVYPNVLLFKAGDYPDKGIRIGAGDLVEMVRNTEPFNLNLEHADDGAFSALIESGLVGRAEKFWIDPDDASVVRAKVRVHKAIDEHLEIKGISVEIPYEGPRRFTGAGLTYTPRVAEAALMAAFNDLASQEAKKPTAGPAGTTTTGGKPKMNFWDWLKAKFAADGGDPSTLGDGPTPAPTTTQPSANFKAELEQQAAAFQAQAITEKAEAFYDGLLREQKAVPAEKDQIVARYSAAMKADNPATVNFSAGERLKSDGEMTKMVAGLYSARKPHGLDEEQVKSADLTAVFAGTRPTSAPLIDTSGIYARLNGKEKK